jgi:hypothetical protein
MEAIQPRSDKHGGLGTMRQRGTISVAAAMLTWAGTAGASITIDTLSSWDGSSAILSFGEPNVAYVGQTFRALDTELANIEVVLDGLDWVGEPHSTSFHLLVAPLAPTNDRPDLNNILFESNPLATSLNQGYETFNVPLNVSVIPGETYMFVLDAFVAFDGLYSDAAIGVNPDSYSDGGVLFLNVEESAPTLRTDHDAEAWTVSTVLSDLAFQMTFVPEPSTAVFLGVLCFTVGQRRRGIRLQN